MFNYLKLDDSSNLFLFGSEQNVTPDLFSSSKYLLYKTNLSGDSLSSFYFGGDSCEVTPKDFIKTLDGNFVFSGYTLDKSSKSSWVDYTLLVKINDSGEMIWEKKLDLHIGKLTATSDSGVIFCDYYQHDRVRLIKFDNKGNILWTREIKLNGGDDMECNGIVESSDGGLLIIGNVTYENSNFRMFLLKTTSEGFLTDISVDDVQINTFNLTQNYPNPFNPSTTITYSVPKASFVTLKVFDILGQEVKTLVNEEKTRGRYELLLDCAEFPSGVYIYKLNAGNFVEAKKMVLTK